MNLSMNSFVCPLVALLTCPLLMASEDIDASLGSRGELVFSDDFDRDSLAPKLKSGIPGFDMHEGTLRGTQARADHGSSVGAVLPLPSGDVVLEMKFRFEGAKSININFDDKEFKGVHAGHISRVVIRPNAITLMDDREGVMRNDIHALLKSSDPKEKAEGQRLSANASKKIPVELEQGTWYTIKIEIVADRMRVSIDGTPIGVLQSPGLAHPTKPDLRIGAWGQNQFVYFEDLRVWSVQPL
jgi:hypothetical protein